jgi:hypothetical protein
LNGLQLWHGKATGQDADDLVRLAVEIDLSTNSGWIASKSRLPELIADDGDVRGGPNVVDREESAHGRSGTEHAK